MTGFHYITTQTKRLSLRETVFFLDLLYCVYFMRIAIATKTKIEESIINASTIARILAAVL